MVRCSTSVRTGECTAIGYTAVFAMVRGSSHSSRRQSWLNTCAILSKRFVSSACPSSLSPCRRTAARCRFTATAIYAPQNVEKLEAAFKEEIARMLKDGFTADEVVSAKTGYLQSRQVSRAQDNELASRLNSYLFIDRTLRWDADLEAKIKALTPDQINTAMRRHIDPAKISIFKAGDFKK